MSDNFFSRSTRTDSSMNGASHGSVLQSLIAEFDRMHRSPANRVCHYIGLPLIALAVLGGLARVSWSCEIPIIMITSLDLALLALALGFVIDIFLNWRLALVVLVAGSGTYLVGRELPLWALAAAFAGGWFFQILGHAVFEDNPPAFTRNWVHLFIGPRWLLSQFRSVAKVNDPPNSRNGLSQD